MFLSTLQTAGVGGGTPFRWGTSSLVPLHHPVAPIIRFLPVSIWLSAFDCGTPAREWVLKGNKEGHLQKLLNEGTRQAQWFGSCPRWPQSIQVFDGIPTSAGDHSIHPRLCPGTDAQPWPCSPWVKSTESDAALCTIIIFMSVSVSSFILGMHQSPSWSDTFLSKLEFFFWCQTSPCVLILTGAEWNATSFLHSEGRFSPRSSTVFFSDSTWGLPELAWSLSRAAPAHLGSPWRTPYLRTMGHIPSWVSFTEQSSANIPRNQITDENDVTFNSL